METLNNLEDSLTMAIESKHRAIHVLTITTSGFREHVFYARESTDLGPILSGIREGLSGYEIQPYAEKDKGWSVYAQFSE